MKTFSVFLFVLLFASTPLSVLAQTATTTATTTPPTDGSTESRAERRERIRGWRQQNTAQQQKISALDANVVASVPMPVLFGVALNNISPNFGDSRSGGRTHEGEDIMAIKGTPIVSPTAAVVLRVGVGETEGNYVYTANPGGETFVYMHLDKIGEGVVEGLVLETGGLIGYVGNTGNASGGAAHLHFEIHNSSRDPIDPFPRLTKEFTVGEKIFYLNKILTQTSDVGALSTLLVENFRSTFVLANSQSIALPPSIVSLMASLLDTRTSTTPSTPTLPAGDLTVGSRGAEVTTLQTYLISKKAGAEALRLAEAGATGYFGVVTQAALREYQSAMNINPADGYYGPATRAVVATSANVPTTPTVPNNPAPTPTPSSGATTLTRNLYKGLTGADVLVLQKFLNTHGFVVATTGAGSPGNETTYFGAATEAAVIKLQTANNISPAAGYVGAITRGYINSVSN